MAASTASNLLPCLFLIITHKGNRFQVVPGQKVIIPGQKVIIPRAHLLTTRKRAVVLPDGSRALSEGDAPAGPRPAGSTEAGSRQRTGFGATSFSALWWPRGA